MHADLRRWSREHGVVWEVRPALALHHGELGPIGFEVTLAALVADARPACAACLGAFGRLRAIAAAAVPDGPFGATACRPRGFDSALRFRSDRGRLLPEVQLVLDVEHPKRYFDGPDDEQVRYVHALQQALAALGVRPAQSQ